MTSELHPLLSFCRFCETRWFLDLKAKTNFSFQIFARLRHFFDDGVMIKHILSTIFQNEYFLEKD